ncbi:MAG: general secretion pathway protein GspB [Gammaproteobacteria bacterium]|jgi:general secretion pathway protein B
MSYILEALRKADQERTVGNVPDLESVHSTGQAADHTNRWLWIVGALLLFNGILIAVLVLRNGGGMDEKPFTSQSVVARDSAPAATTEPPRKAPAAQNRQPLPGQASPPVAPAAENTVAYRPPVKAPPPPQPQAKGQVIVADSPLSVQDEAPVVAKATVKRADSTAAPVAQASPGIPDWNDLSLEFRGSFPAPRVDVHVYDSDPKRRFVLIDLQKYRQGDRLQSGALLEEILPDGIQLLYQGTQFIYRK